MFMRFSSSSSSVPILCVRCSEPISTAAEPDGPLLTSAANRFFCSQKHCGRALCLGEYGVHQNKFFCANCFVSLFSIENGHFANKSIGESHNEIGTDQRNRKEENAFGRQHYERQLRTVQLGDDDQEGQATVDEHEEQQQDEETPEGGHSFCARTSAWSKCFGAQKAPVLPPLGTDGRGGARHGHLLLTSPIPELDEREAELQQEGMPVVPLSAASSPCPSQPSMASPASAALRCFAPRFRPDSPCRRSELLVQRPFVCKRCAQRVFEAEKIVAAGEVWHKRCFRCLRCGRSLEPGKFSDRVGEIFCNNCYAKNFGPKGVGCGIGAGILQMHQ